MFIHGHLFPLVTFLYVYVSGDLTLGAIVTLLNQIFGSLTPPTGVTCPER